MIPEAYRQKFRGWKRRHQSHLEFAKKKWCKAEKVTVFEGLAQLILIEEFKNSVSPAVRAHLDEKMTSFLSEAARLADQFELTRNARVKVANSTG